MDSKEKQQLDRIESKLDEVLEFRDQLRAMLAAFGNGGGKQLLKMLGGAK